MDEEKDDSFNEFDKDSTKEDALVDISPDDLSDDELMKMKKPAKQFNISIDKKIDNIPDYVVVPRGKVKKRSKLGVLTKVMMAFIIVGLSIFLSFSIIFAAQDVFGMNKNDQAYIVDIEKNSSVTDIAKVLEEKGVINSAFLFRAYYKLTQTEAEFQFGTYPLNSKMSYDAIIDQLQRYTESKAEARVVFPEGCTLYEMAVLLQENEVCNAEAFLNTIDTEDFGFDFEKNIWDSDLRFHRLEGYAYPDTYNFYVGETPISAAKRMLKNFDNRVGALLKEKASSTGMSQEKIMTIASIVQLEAGEASEMKKVASVYLNRLNAPADFARLQADPTRDYANQLKLQMDIIDQEVLDAYNTYVGQGLPPSPICNPGLDAIMAVLEPEETEFYYFCTNLSTGDFYYAKTLKEHNANVRKAGLRQ